MSVVLHTAFLECLFLMGTTLLMSMKASKAVEHVRSGKGPVLIESVTYRWLGHSSSDPGKYRTREEVEEWKKKDPIENLRKYLLENEIASAEELDQIQEEVKEAVEASVKFAEESPFHHSNQLSKIFTQTKGSRELWKLN